MRVKFEGNLIMHLHFMADIYKCVKRRKSNKENERLFEAYISGTASVIYFRSGMCSLPICWYLHSKFGLVWSRDHRATNVPKIALCSSS